MDQKFFERKRSRRLRKKLHVGEFKESAYLLTLNIDDTLSIDQFEKLYDDKYNEICTFTEVKPKQEIFFDFMIGGPKGINIYIGFFAKDFSQDRVDQFKALGYEVSIIDDTWYDEDEC